MYHFIPMSIISILLLITHLALQENTLILINNNFLKIN